MKNSMVHTNLNEYFNIIKKFKLEIVVTFREMRTFVHGHSFPNTRKQMEAGNLTDVSISAIGWVTHISMKTVVYFNQSKNILYHD